VNGATFSGRRKMKILIVNPSCWIYGGAERVIVELANWLTEHHHSVTLLTTQISKEMLEDLKNTRMVIAESFGDLHDFIQNAAHEFDVINVHNEPGYLSVFPKKRNVVWSCNEPPHLEHPNPTDVELECVRNFKVVVADQFNADRFEKLYNIKPKIIPYGIDYDFYSGEVDVEKCDKIMEEYNIDYGFNILQVGFLADTKNQLRTIEIFKKVKDNIPEAKLILAGQPVKEYAEEVRKKVAEYGLLQDVIITNFVDRETIKCLYNISNVALFPIKSQGGWLSVFEAMSAGVPVFVSEEATCSSMLRENGIGTVCKTDEEFVEALSRDTADNAQEWVKENLTWDKYCEAMLEYYGK